MKILGIDPGYDRLGIAIIEKPLKGKETVLYSDCLQTSAKDPINKRLLQIGTEVGRILDEYGPQSLAIETLFITKNQKTAMRVSEARGIIMYEAFKRDVPVFEYAPMQIKTAITSDGTSDKDRMIKMVELLVKLPAKKRVDDEYDAIAVALTHSALCYLQK
ncbi:MAG: crossover junction endodeoxyribonuclease RuvC [Patescibacteria group bacterium]